MKRIEDKITINRSIPALQMIRIDSDINEVINRYTLRGGVCIVKVPEGAIVTTIEYEPGLINDFRKAYARFKKMKMEEKIDPYLLTKFVKNEMHFPYNLGRLVIGDWQQVVVFTEKEFPEGMEISLSFKEEQNILGLQRIFTEKEFETREICAILETDLKWIEKDSYVTMITPDSTAIIFTLKDEKLEEFYRILYSIAPQNIEYDHNKLWGDVNGHSHVRASFVGQSITLPVAVGGKIVLENNEKLFLTELNTFPMRRDIYFRVWTR